MKQRLSLWGFMALLACATAAHAAGDIKAGEAIATNGLAPVVPACATCHGAKGEGTGAFPPLAGQGAAYLQAQLAAYAKGERKSPVMEPVAKGLKEQDAANAAAYFASLPSGIALPKAAPVPDPKNPGAWLALRGRMNEGVPACASCHGPNGEGVGSQFPAIGKLSAAYMQQQVDAWKSGTRGPGPLGLMQEIAKKLSPQDIDAVAKYYASSQ